MTILDAIRDLKKQYRDGHDKQANTLKLTRDAECQLEALAPAELPDSVASVLLRAGARKAFESIYGMRVIWDAEQTEVLVENEQPLGFFRGQTHSS